MREKRIYVSFATHTDRLKNMFIYQNMLHITMNNHVFIILKIKLALLVFGIKGTPRVRMGARLIKMSMKNIVRNMDGILIGTL